ncbi:serine/threonine protein phosphatase [Streptococcus chenjunshii]|uniref:Serine/threonine protein phosphatase n=1 Tax=Streptococcus chenjunshii TaxID=2173853 RepID=A0A372KN83_9STRE|nr:metallophosphoesterase family protein [Streptococcus chenjunshii]AXQ78200.1 serine/threonine protein phosphatase [Streptococcus chenjunshii]RFU50929.1 serine/threonine protein phosphatase [Streptococcus chenjunshii]RFU53426.1 serine/threonine protein phosphatase [Streptococcus chenjunshii]
MKEKLFIIGDVHGEYAMLEELLRHWNPADEQLVFLGDLGDRGPDPKNCFLKVYELVQTAGAVCVSGNHEDMLLNWLADPKKEIGLYLLNGGRTTIESFFYQGILAEKSPQEIAQLFEKDYSDLLLFLKNLPLYYESDFCLCVHAGVNLDLADWRQSSRYDFIWSREEFFAKDAALDKLTIFGHTPLPYLHQNTGQTHLWYHNNKLNIDGGAAYGGSLHGVVISDGRLQADYQIFSKNYHLS